MNEWTRTEAVGTISRRPTTATIGRTKPSSARERSAPAAFRAAGARAATCATTYFVGIGVALLCSVCTCFIASATDWSPVITCGTTLSYTASTFDRISVTWPT